MKKYLLIAATLALATTPAQAQNTLPPSFTGLHRKQPAAIAYRRQG
jgi:hypothetical protein